MMSLKLDDVISTDAFAENPFPAYRELQASDPVQWSDTWGCWVVTRYDDVRACLQDYRRFSNRGRITGLFHEHFDAKQLLALTPLISHYSHGLINADPPDHTRIRKILHEVFNPSTIIRFTECIPNFVDELINEVISWEFGFLRGPRELWVEFEP